MPVKKHILKVKEPMKTGGSFEDILVATWNAAKDEKNATVQANRDPERFFRENAHRHLILLQEAGKADEREALAAKANGFEYLYMGKGLALAYKDQKMHYDVDESVYTDATIPGYGGRDGVASCAIFVLNKLNYKRLPLRVLNIHAGHNSLASTYAASVQRIRNVWERKPPTPLNIIGGDMNELHDCKEAQDLVGFQTYSKAERTHSLGAHSLGSPDQLGALGRDVIASVECFTGENYGSDHKCKLLDIKLKQPTDFGGKAGKAVGKGKYCNKGS